MAQHRGPKTITQDLVFHYDTGNVKSFAGEPTTNVLTNTDLDNGWLKGYHYDIIINDTYPKPVGITSQSVSFKTSNTYGYWFSYGDYAPQEDNTTYSISVWARTVGASFYIQPYTADNSESHRFWMSSKEVTGNGEWQRLTWDAAFTTPANNDSDSLSFHFPTIPIGQRCWLLAPQLEPKIRSTPFVVGSRTNTQSLFDLTRNRTISVSGVSFGTNSTMLFDGTDDAIPITTPPNFSGSGSWTMNTWFKINGAPSSSVYMNVIVDMDPTGGSANMICVNWSDMRLQYRSRPVGGSYTDINGSTLSQGVWYNATVVRYGTNETKLFLNGVQDGGTYSGNLPAGNQSFFNVGRWTDGTVYANATIPIVSIYNRALTPDEVYRNYMSLKARFGL